MTKVPAENPAGGRSGKGAASVLPYLQEALRHKVQVNTSADEPAPPAAPPPPPAPPQE